MSSQPVIRTSLVSDLLRLAIPVVLIACAVAASLWIDRSTGFQVTSMDASTVTWGASN